MNYFNRITRDAPGGAEGAPAPIVPPIVPPAPTPPADRQSGFSAEYVRDLREENKARRLTEAAAIEATTAEKAARAADKAAHEEALKTAKTEAEKAAESRVIRAEMRTAAIKAGMVDLDGLKLADLSAVKLDDKGEVIGADALMEALKTSKPYLFGTAKTGTSDSATPPPKPGETTPKKASEMTPAEYEAAKRGFVKGKA